MKNIIQELAEEYINKKVAHIDEHLTKFLLEQGLYAGSVEETKNQLKEKGLELITEVNNTDTHEVYVFKLCKIYAETDLHFVKPDLLNFKIINSK